MRYLRRPAVLRRAWWRENWRENPLLWAELRRTFKSPWLTLLVVGMFVAVVFRYAGIVSTYIYLIAGELQNPGAGPQERLSNQVWFEPLGLAEQLSPPMSAGILGLLIALAWRRDRTISHREGIMLTGRTHGQMIVARAMVWGLPVVCLLVFLSTLLLILKVTHLAILISWGDQFTGHWWWFTAVSGSAVSVIGLIGTVIGVMGLAILMSMRSAPVLLIAVLCGLVGMNHLILSKVFVWVSFHPGVSESYYRFHIIVSNCGILPFAILFWWLARREVRRKYPM